ncbi:efflux RND transporter periplasmic adaptor subunit [Paenibacillus sp. DXFW5]|uniref:Efflux RND transporter periplasmic adaptor subunit n=1 Tax=Paenibacillus rhizolycopersici TaxID=2780073 RepID=A0ABS2H7D2_9BACL|nr:efflux RND transporter periplasmic adaptor subunit [Paenibacillus rhizolycopersici]MBM6996656.1 efflux RND transporter periplasmic adaptor subunit [Paenibacillus rhizolycopersici]
MEAQWNEESRLRVRQRKIRWLAGLFIGLLLVFTLLGNTLQNLMLPRVLVAAASPGELAHSYEGSALLKYGATQALMNPAGWKVSQVHVKEGDVVRKGDLLIEYDDREATQELADMKANLEKLKLLLADGQEAYKQAAQVGDESAQQSARTAIQTAKIDIATQGQHLAALHTKIEDNRRLVAPFDGTIIEISAVEGQASAGGPDIRLSDSSKGFRLELLIPNDVAELVRVGDELDVLLPDQENSIVQGQISSLEANAGSDSTGSGTDQTDLATTPGQLLTVLLHGDHLRSGIKARVVMTKTGSAGTLLVPKAAIHEDDAGTFVYTVEPRESPLGNAYYVARANVEVAGSNGYNTAITGGVFEGQQVIVESTDPILEGSRVRF